MQQWLAWYQALLSEPGDPQTPWVPERMEYEFAVRPPHRHGEIVLNAAEYVEGRLDWYDFSLQPGASLGASPSETRYTDSVRAPCPSPVSFPGHARQSVVGIRRPPDRLRRACRSNRNLVSLVMVEFALIYGNDWFIVPVELDVGSLTRIRSLKVTDSFGEVTTIPPFTPPAAPAGAWRMFSLATDPRYPPAAPRRASAVPADARAEPE